MSLIAHSERQDFDRVIDEAGLSRGDFVVKEKPDVFPIGGVAADTGTVTVTYTPTGVTREYQAGHVSKWTAQFEQDLNSNVFKTY